jgi:hypothetical protein
MILMLLITGCAHQKDGVTYPRLEWSGEPNLHQVSSATLREKMRSLKVRMFDNIYDDLQFEEEQAIQADNDLSRVPDSTSAICSVFSFASFLVAPVTHKF